jgi:hypothetical protein
MPALVPPLQVIEFEFLMHHMSMNISITYVKIWTTGKYKNVPVHVPDFFFFFFLGGLTAHRETMSAVIMKT